MSIAWYYTDYQRNRLGPVQADDLRQLHEAGQLAADTLVWREGWAQWKPWHEAIGEVVAGVGRPSLEAASFATARGDAPAHAGNPYAIAEPRSPYAPPAARLADDAGVVHGGEVVDAGFWKRYAAYAIDGLLIGIVTMVVQFMILGAALGSAGLAGGPEAVFSSTAGVMAMAMAYLIPLALQAVYFAWFHAGSAQATLGKMAVGIKVVDADGGRISFARGIGRYFATVLSSLVLGIGFLMAGFTERKRALHDMVCNTLVVDRWAYTAHPERQRRELGGVTLAIIVLSLLLCLGYMGVVASIGAFAAMAGRGG